ncbi:MAG: pilus assembly protein TadG-related protein [Rubripirellula sp.]|nr:pilus assembly protein TadG-related protein [Rubripirellula sp.]
MSKCKSQRGVFWGGLLRLPTQRLHRGAAAILGIFLLVALATLTAITIDFGYIHVAETQLRRSADAAAMAGCWEVFVQQDTGEELDSTLPMLVVNSANVIASKNVVGDISPLLRHDDVELGNYHPVDGWIDSSISQANAVRVTLHRGAGANSELPLLFAALTGRGSQAMQATAVAAMLNSVDGFIEPPSVFETRGILPIALDLESWEAAVAASTVDNYQMKDGQVVSGSDGVFETDLYPKGTGAPGNRGTVDIGDSNNSTSDLSRQILHGISRQDFVDLGKPLLFDVNGELHLNGDTGISAGIKDELAALIGKKRIVPIFTEVSGQGNNATFTIVKFEGVRILDVKLTGKKSQKRVVVQPAKVIGRGIKVDWSGTHTTSHLFTPVMLVE